MSVSIDYLLHDKLEELSLSIVSLALPIVGFLETLHKIVWLLWIPLVAAERLPYCAEAVLIVMVEVVLAGGWAGLCGPVSGGSVPEV